jgi:N4-gp56 family major capsid protein
MYDRTTNLSAFDPKDKVELAKAIDTAVMYESTFASMIGAGENAPIRTYKEDSSAVVTTHRLRDLLRGIGVKGNSDFDTNEGKMKYLSQDFRMEIFGHSIRSDDMRIHQFKDDYDFTEQATDALKDWLTDMFDRKIFAALSNDCTNIVACKSTGGLTQLPSTIGDNDTFSVAAIREAARRARMGVDASGNPVPVVRPYKVKVKEIDGVPIKQNRYICMVSPTQAEQLKSDTEWKEIQKYAASRGDDHSFFTGVIGAVDEVIVVMAQQWSDEYAGIISNETDTSTYFHDGFDSTLNSTIYTGSSSKKTEVALFFGATAVGMPISSNLNIYADKTVDMGRKMRIGVDRMISIAKSRFIGLSAEQKASRYHNKDLSTIAIVSRMI